MSKIESIEHEVERLDGKAFAAFREWFMAYDNARWDRQIEADSKNGKLDSLIQEAATAHRSGQSTALRSILLLPNSGRSITPCPPMFEILLTKVFNFSKPIRLILHCISRSSAAFGLFALACTTVRSLLKLTAAFYGFGLARTVNTTNYVSNSRFPPIALAITEH